MIRSSLLVLACCVLSYAIAVGFLYWGTKPSTLGPFGLNPDALGEPVQPTPRDIRSWRRRASPDWPEPPQIANEHRFFGVRHSTMLRYKDVPDLVHGPVEQHDYLVWAHEFGWPFLSAGAESWTDYQEASLVQWRQSFIDIGNLRLPGRIIWSGLIANALIYAILIVSVSRGMIGARRLNRRRRGHCPQCSYDLQHELQAGCSECGWNRASRSHSSSPPA